MLQTDNPKERRELVRETNEEGFSTVTWAGIAFVLMVIGGIAMYVFASDTGVTTNAKGPPGLEQTVPPATTSQGGAKSRMPAADSGRLEGESR